MADVTRRSFVRSLAAVAFWLCLRAPRLSARFITASDNFGGTDNTSSLGSNWTNHDSSNPMGIYSNRAYTVTFGSFSAAFWSNTTFTADHFSQVTVVDASGGVLVTVRASGSTAGTQAFYALAGDPGGASIVKVNAGVMAAPIASVTGTIQNGDVVYVEAVGTTITVKVNGVVKGTATDATIATGQPGIGSFAPATLLDDWSAGDIAGGGGGGGGSSVRRLLTLGVGQ